MSLTSPFSLLDQATGQTLGTRERLYGLAERICNPELIRRTDSIEFTDLTTISHHVRTEFPGDSWPERVTGTGESDPGTGFVFLGFLRRGIPLQHSEVTMYRGGEEYDLPRFRTTDTEDLAVLLLDAVWLSCASNELGGIPRPLENSSGKPPENPDDRFQVAPFWQEFLGMRGRSVNPDWDLLKTRFELSESGWANEIWRPPSGREPKWSHERALLAKLCSKLAFSYIGAAWVPENAMSASEGPFEVEFEFQERILRPEEQVERVRSLRRRSKKAFERSLLAFRERLDRHGSSQKKRDLTPPSLDTDLWRLDNVPETYLGVLDPALDDPDANRRWPAFNRSEPIFDAGRGTISTFLHSWIFSFSGIFLILLAAGTLTGIPGSMWPRLVAAVALALLLATALGNVRSLVAALLRVSRQILVLAVVAGAAAAFWFLPGLPGVDIPGTTLPVIPLALIAGWLLVRLNRFLKSGRRETVILPTWSAGSGSASYEVSCPPEFIVWQGILARPSNRGRAWKTRPASELGAKAHLWWSEPNDRGWVEDPPGDRPQLLVLELRARLSPTIALIGALLGLATALLLIAPALANLLDFPLEKASFGDLGADFVATVLLLLPTIGGAILIQPAEDPIARKLLGRDRLVVAASTILPSVLAVLSLLLFGWWWDGEKDTGESLWKAWLALGAVSLTGSGLLFLAWTQCRGSSVPAPSARQGGVPPYSNPRRRPLDIPAPLRSLRTLKGRLFAERSLLRLAPRRSGRTPRPVYSLVLPIEGSRLYTPPAPTVLCLIEDPGLDTENGSEHSLIDRFIDEVLPGLAGRDGLARGARNTNVIGWQPDAFLSVPSPRKAGPESYEEKLSEAGDRLSALRFFIRLQKANTKPSHLKPVGNGGGLVPMRVGGLGKPSFKGLTPHKVEDLLNDRELDSELLGSGEESWRRDRLVAAVCRRAVVDVDGVLLIPIETVRSCVGALPAPDTRSEEGHLGSESHESASTAALPPALEAKKDDRLSRSLARFAASGAHRAGTGSGAHVWPSSFEPPLAGESPGWLGRTSPRAMLSLRYLFFRPDWQRFRAWLARAISRLQGFFFDNERRRIPVARLGPASSAGSAERNSLSNFLLNIPRAFSGVKTQDLNARVQRNLWFTQEPARRKADGRALPVMLETGVPVEPGTPCTGRVVTDVVGDRVWVWSSELGIDHRNFRFRSATRSDVEVSIQGTGREIELLTPEWPLGQSPVESEGACVGLEPRRAVYGTDSTRSGRSIFGQLTGAREVSDALSSFGKRDSTEPRLVARLTGPQGELLSEKAAAEEPVVIVEDSGGNLEHLADLSSGDLVLVGRPPLWSGGTVVRPPELGMETSEIKAVLVGGLVASGKSELSRMLRTQMEMDDERDEEYWEVIRIDPRHNLFLQLFDFDQVETMDELEGLDFSRDPSGELNRQLARLSAETSLLESIDLLEQGYGRAGKYRGGVIVEYWPEFLVKVMAAAEKGRSLSSDDYLALSEHLGAWESVSDAWQHFSENADSRVCAIHLMEDPETCRRRAVKKGFRRHNLRISEEELIRLEEVLQQEMPDLQSGNNRPDWPLVPDGTYGIVLPESTIEDLSREIPRIAREIRDL